MRIVGGHLSGRKLEPPENLTTRPMMDRVRQALFNILAHHDWGQSIGSVLNETEVLDAFCGTGALAFEALSWGASFATLFDQEIKAVKVAVRNATMLGLLKVTSIQTLNTLKPPRATRQAKLVFLAPPYRKGLISPALEALDKAGWLERHPLVVAETAKAEELTLPSGWISLLCRFYGDTALHFISRLEP